MNEDQNGEIDDLLKEIENKINAGDYSEEAEELSACMAFLTSKVVSNLMPDKIKGTFDAILEPRWISRARYETFSQYIRSPEGQTALRLLRDSIDRFLDS